MDEIIDFVERLNKGLIGGNLLMKNLVALKLIHLKKKTIKECLGIKLSYLQKQRSEHH
jgi:hypothetical protein